MVVYNRRDLINEAYKFVDKSTTSKPKLNVIEWENALINNVSPHRSLDEELVGLVGNPEGLMRHIDQWKRIGFRPANMMVVEKNRQLAQQLQQQCKHLATYYPSLNKLTQNIYNADMFKFLEKRGENVTHVDFDGISSISTLRPTLENIAVSCPRIKTAVVVMTTRTGLDEAHANRAFSQQGKHLQKDAEYFIGILHHIDPPRAAAFRRVLFLLDKQTDLYEEIINDILQEDGDYVDLKYNVYKPRMISVVASFDGKLAGGNVEPALPYKQVGELKYSLNLIWKASSQKDRVRFYKFLVKLYEHALLLQHPTEMDRNLIDAIYDKIVDFSRQSS
jgi:hypothetical protein